MLWAIASLQPSRFPDDPTDTRNHPSLFLSANNSKAQDKKICFVYYLLVAMSVLQEATHVVYGAGEGMC